MRSAKSSTLAQPDGTLTLQSYSTPVRVSQGSGWVDLDDTLVDDGLAVYPKSSDVAMRFAAGGTDPLAAMSAGVGSLQLGWPTRLPTPSLDGQSATYHDVSPGVDVVVVATTGGFDVRIVLTRRPAGPVSFTLPVTADGLTPVDSAGALGFADADGTLVVDGAPPSMADATTDDHSGEPLHTAAVPLTLEHR